MREERQLELVGKILLQYRKQVTDIQAGSVGHTFLRGSHTLRHLYEQRQSIREQAEADLIYPLWFLLENAQSMWGHRRSAQAIAAKLLNEVQKGVFRDALSSLTHYPHLSSIFSPRIDADQAIRMPNYVNQHEPLAASMFDSLCG